MSDPVYCAGCNKVPVGPKHGPGYCRTCREKDWSSGVRDSRTRVLPYAGREKPSDDPVAAGAELREGIRRSMSSLSEEEKLLALEAYLRESA